MTDTNEVQEKEMAAQTQVSGTKITTQSRCDALSSNQQCLFCGEKCKTYDPKNPPLWLRVIQLETSTEVDGISFKQHIEDLCKERSDLWADEVAARMKDSTATANLLYHIPCYFMFGHSPMSVSTSQGPVEEALRSVAKLMVENLTKIWTISKLYSKYLDFSGSESKAQFVSNIRNHFGDELLVLHVDGYESLMAFESYLSQYIDFVKKNSDDETANQQVRTNVRRINYAL